MKKVLCLLYPQFSLYEITALTSTLVLTFGVEIDYVSSSLQVMLSEDGLPCYPTKSLDEVELSDYSCIILPGMMNLSSALNDEKLIRFLESLKREEILIAAISSAPILLAKAGLLVDKSFTGGIWHNFFDYFDFLPKENFELQPIYRDKNVITAVGFAHQAFARLVLVSLGLTDTPESYFKEKIDYQQEDFIFKMSDQDFALFKQEFENTL